MNEDLEKLRLELESLKEENRLAQEEKERMAQEMTDAKQNHTAEIDK
jgi:uncharacterized protein (DUF3084 family)